MSAEPWRSIETAPRDGTIIEAYRPGMEIARVSWQTIPLPEATLNGQPIPSARLIGWYKARGRLYAPWPVRWRPVAAGEPVVGELCPFATDQTVEAVYGLYTITSNALGRVFSVFYCGILRGTARSIDAATTLVLDDDEEDDLA